MNVLITGAGGFLGQGLVQAFERPSYTLRLMDVTPFESAHETLIASVSDLEACDRAVRGMNAIVMSHMASRANDAYDKPTQPFDVNVKGTANLFHAIVEHGIKKVVLISTRGVIKADPRDRVPRDAPHMSSGYYGLSKVCQEVIAEQFSREHGITVSCLRPSYIVCADGLIDKYGREIRKRNPALIDRRDIGQAARLCLEKVESGLEIFPLSPHPDALESWDVQYTQDRLDWRPEFDFSELE